MHLAAGVDVPFPGILDGLDVVPQAAMAILIVIAMVIPPYLLFVAFLTCCAVHDYLGGQILDGFCPFTPQDRRRNV